MCKWDTTRNRRLPILAIALGLIAGGCVQTIDQSAPAPQPVTPAPLVSGTTPQPVPTPTFTPPPTPSPADQQLAAAVAGSSMTGTNPANDDYCTYYAPDGNLMTVLRGSSPEAGTWSVSGGALCERLGVGATTCKQVAFQPAGQSVTLTPLQGGVGRQTTATLTRGNICPGY